MSNEINKSKKYFSLCVKAFIFFQLLILVGVANPWSALVVTVCLILLLVDIVIIVFWCVPIFFYQMVKLKKSFKEAFQISLISFFDILSFVNV